MKDRNNWTSLRIRRSTRELLVERRNLVSQMPGRHFSMGHFLELLIRHGRLEESDFLNFKPIERGPGRRKAEDWTDKPGWVLGRPPENSE